jgi:hypothetical protein
VADFEAFEDAMVEGEKLIIKEFASERGWAIREALARFVRDSEPDLRRWTEKLKARKISQAEFEDLVVGQERLFQLSLLTSAGVGKAEALALKEAQLRFIVRTAAQVFL